MEFKPFSQKQKLSMLWWADKSTARYDGIICDGAVRSGKTVSMALGFILWAMSECNDGAFAVCGKTITSVRRNIITPMLPVWKSWGFKCSEKTSLNYLDVVFGGRKNRFYLFGGKDESSASLIQGMTLNGVFLDETALMPRSFVEQALARCSQKNSKLWFNCNPESPNHWFYKEWILKAEEKNVFCLHFTMDDNPSLSEKIKIRYKTLYSGIFYDRFVLGKWTAATGLVYPMFKESEHVFKKGDEPKCSRYVVSCDYGTVNPSSFGLWGYSGGTWYRIDEYYYSSREKGQLLTDEEHYDGLLKLCGGYDIECVIADPSAASFMECIRRHARFRVIPADNSVLSGIRRVSEALRQKKLMFSEKCIDTIREFGLYVWDEKNGCDSPLKENDHAMDEIRYLVNTITDDSADSFFVVSLKR